MVTPPLVPTNQPQKFFPRPPQVPRPPAIPRGSSSASPLMDPMQARTLRKQPTVVPPTTKTSTATVANSRVAEKKAIITPQSHPEEQTPGSSSTPADETNAAPIVVRTMQEDLKSIASGTPDTTTGKPPAGTAQPDNTSVKPGAVTKATLPLPPTSGANAVNTKQVKQPTRRKRKRLIPVLVTILAIAILGGGGILGWYLLYGNQNQPGGNSGLVGNAEDSIPADTTVIVQYKLTSAADRTATLSAWNNTTPASVTTLLRGDPRLLLDDSSIEEFYYVLIPEDTRPYLVVPKTSSTSDLLDGTADAETIEHNGWLIVHSLDTALYMEALSENTLTAIGGEAILTSTTPDTPLRLVLGPAALSSLREDILGSALVNGDIQSAEIAGRFEAGQLAMTISGTARTLSSATTNTVIDQKILSYIPATSAATKLGTNFAADVTALSTTGGEVDSAILQQPEVAALLSQLTTPYGFFIDTSSPSGLSYGLIVQLPQSLHSAMPLGDTRLETALRALVPLLVGRKSIAPLEFNNAIYRDIPLRFVNITGSNQAIDYAKSDSYLLIASTKETMFALLDAASGQTTPIHSSPQWFDLFQLWGALPQTADMTVATTTSQLLLQFLPQTPGAIQFGITLDPTVDNPATQQLQGVVRLLNGNAVQ